jgi:hypothetical protein
MTKCRAGFATEPYAHVTILSKCMHVVCIVSFQINSKEIRQAEHEYMNIHPSQISALAAAMPIRFRLIE